MYLPLKIFLEAQPSLRQTPPLVPPPPPRVLHPQRLACVPLYLPSASTPQSLALARLRLALGAAAQPRKPCLHLCRLPATPLPHFSTAAMPLYPSPLTCAAPWAEAACTHRSVLHPCARPSRSPPTPLATSPQTDPVTRARTLRPSMPSHAFCGLAGWREGAAPTVGGACTPPAFPSHCSSNIFWARAISVPPCRLVASAAAPLQSPAGCRPAQASACALLSILLPRLLPPSLASSFICSISRLLSFAFCIPPTRLVFRIRLFSLLPPPSTVC